MLAQLMNYSNCVESLVNDKTKPWYSIFQMLEEKTSVKKAYLFHGGVILIGLYLVFGWGPQLLCNTIGFLYPAYASLKAIETPQKGDDTKWLTYWTTFAFFSIVEYPSDILLYWFPFYWLIKCIFMIWLFAPIENNGSIIIYHRFIRPYFLKHNREVDSLLDKLAGPASDVLKEVKNAVKRE